MQVVGFLAISSRDTYGYLVDAFRQGLSESGYVEGRNVAIEYRWADNQIEAARGAGATAGDAGRSAHMVAAFCGGLTENGYVEGQNDAGLAADQVRVRDQPQRSQGTRDQLVGQFAVACRRGHRMRRGS
jgi:hypothetical protein